MNEIMRAFGLGLIALPLAIVLSLAAFAVEEVKWSSCSDERTEVGDAADDEFDLICSAVARAVGFLQNCGLSPPPLLRVQVARGPISIDGIEVFGCFDANKGTILVLDSKECSKAAVTNKAYKSLPAAEFYQSIIAHEVAHWVFRSNLGGRTLPRTAHEYVAYAVQISLMPEGVRHKFLTPIKRSPPSDLGRFSNTMLIMAPEAFGAMAYDHFSAIENGCKFVSKVVQGDEKFPTGDAGY